MKQLLIIYPHWHPANLAGVHRPRLIGNFLPELGWHPIVLTVEEKYYEEPPDRDFHYTFSESFEVYRSGAFPITRPRIIGDIGLRSFFHLYRRALKILREKKIDFIWIPVPSYYPAVLGRLLHMRTRIPYGIDYIDPWVRPIPDYEKRFSRAWWAQLIARRLEPFALKKAALISGVAPAYYQGVIDRYFQRRNVEHVGMPYGFDPHDHRIKLPNLPLPWSAGERVWIYAGAFLPRSHRFIDLLFATIRQLREAREWDERIRMYFFGTGHSRGKSISEYARDHQIADIVVEERDRRPFLHILNFLSAADAVMVIGSTERHYTASKTFQALLSERPVLAVLHAESSAIRFLQQARADNYLVAYREGMPEEELRDQFRRTMANLIKEDRTQWMPDLAQLEPFSAKESARKLVEKLDKITGRSSASGIK